MKRKVKATSPTSPAKSSLRQGAIFLAFLLAGSGWAYWLLQARMGWPLPLLAVSCLIIGAVLGVLGQFSLIARVALGAGMAGSLWRDVAGMPLYEAGFVLWTLGGAIATALALRFAARVILPVTGRIDELNNIGLLVRFAFRDVYTPQKLIVNPKQLPASFKEWGVGFVPSHLALAVKLKKELETRGPGLVWLPAQSIILAAFDLRLHEHRLTGLKATTRDGIPVETSLTLRFCLRRPETDATSPPDLAPFPFDEHAIPEALYATTVEGPDRERLWHERIAPRAAAHLVDMLSRQTLNELYALQRPEVEPLYDLAEDIQRLLADEFQQQGVEIHAVVMGRIQIPEAAMNGRIGQWQQTWHEAIRQQQRGEPYMSQAGARFYTPPPVRHKSLGPTPSAGPQPVRKASARWQRTVTILALLLVGLVYLLVARSLEVVPPASLLANAPDLLGDYTLLPWGRALIALAELAHPRVLRHLIPVLLGIMVALEITLQLLRILYDLPDRQQAQTYLSHLTRGPAQPMPINRPKLEEERATNPLLRLGGPGRILVTESDAIVTERHGQFHRVLGGGLHALTPFETVRAAVDLREQRRSQSNATLVTREGLEFQVDVHVTFRISYGDELPSRANPYPFDKESVRRAVYAERVLQDGKVLSWDTLPLDMTLEQLAKATAAVQLDQIVDPNRRFGPDFDPHLALQNRTQRETERLLRPYGIQLVSVDLRAFELPVPVQETLLRYWQTFSDPLRDAGPSGDTRYISGWWPRPDGPEGEP